jgi:hypothetical protein
MSARFIAKVGMALAYPRRRPRALSVLLAVAAVQGTCVGTYAIATPSHDFDHTFLSDYSRLRPSAPTGCINELRYAADDAAQQVGASVEVLVADPQLRQGPQSALNAKDAAALDQFSKLVRQQVEQSLRAAGYALRVEPSANTLRLRLAITGLEFHKKHRGLLGYTPIGAVIKAGKDAARPVLQQYELSASTYQAEVLNPDTHAAVAQLVASSSCDPKADHMSADAAAQWAGSFAVRLLALPATPGA